MRSDTMLTRMFGAALAFAVPVLAFGADEAGADGAASPNPMAFEIVPYISGLVVFGLAFFILSRTAWPKIVKGLEEREQKIKGDIAQAERTRKQAERALQEYEKALAEARNEASKMLEEAKGEQQKVAAELRARTEAELNAMRDAAKRDIEAAKKAAITEVYGHMADTATSIAARILQRELNPEDQRQLVEESLGQLAAVRN